MRKMYGYLTEWSRQACGAENKNWDIASASPSFLLGSSAFSPASISISASHLSVSSDYLSLSYHARGKAYPNISGSHSVLKTPSSGEKARVRGPAEGQGNRKRQGCPPMGNREARQEAFVMVQVVV